MHSTLTRREILLFSGGIFLLLLFVFGRSLFNDFVFWDDPLVLIDNPISHGLTLRHIADAFSHYDPDLYVPLTFLSFQANFSLVGLHPFLYHLTNLLLHAGSALVIGWIMLQLTGKTFTAAVVALLFAVHPINVEAVAWVSARKDVLSGFFFLLSLALSLRSRHTADPRWYWMSVAAFLLGLLSKASILTLPVILLFLDEYRGKALTKESLMRTAPYALLSVAFGIVALFGKLAGTRTIGEKFLVGMQGVPLTLWHVIWPFNYSVLYPFAGEPSFGRLDLLASVGAVACVSVLTVLVRRRFPSVFLGWWWFLALLLPSFLTVEKGQDLVPELSVTSDRYAYLAGIGMFLIAAQACHLLERRIRRLGVLLAVGVIAALAVLASLQSLTWTNTPSLMMHALKHNPDSSVAHNNLGVFYDANGDADAAFREYEAAVRAGGTGDAWFNFGMALAKQRRFPEAITALQNAVAVRPGYGIAHQNLGAFLLDAGDIQASVDHLLIAQSLDPRNVTIYLNLGMALQRGGDVIDAVAAFKRALQLEPGSAFAQDALEKLKKKQ